MSEPRACTIELFKEAFKFSAGHFTIFSATERERLHGHNFIVYCALTGVVGDNGMTANYTGYKHRIEKLCHELNEYFLLPTRSPYLRIEEYEDKLTAHFGDERIPFLRRDVKLLPVRNVTIEELSAFLLGRLLQDPDLLARDQISKLVVKVGSGPGQWASTTWINEDTPPPDEP